MQIEKLAEKSDNAPPPPRTLCLGNLPIFHDFSGGVQCFCFQFSYFGPEARKTLFWQADSVATARTCWITYQDSFLTSSAFLAFMAWETPVPCVPKTMTLQHHAFLDCSLCGRCNFKIACQKLSWNLTAGFLSRAGAETPLNFREKFRVFPRTILESFSGVDTQTAVLVSTAEVWISAPDTQTPIFLGFLGIHSWLWFFCRETKIFRFFSWGACHQNQGLSTSSV